MQVTSHKLTRGGGQGLGAKLEKKISMPRDRSSSAIDLDGKMICTSYSSVCKMNFFVSTRVLDGGFLGVEVLNGMRILR